MSIHVPEKDIKKTGKLKIFPDGSFEAIASSRPVFCGGGWELADEWQRFPRVRTRKAEPSAEDLERSRRRAAATVREIALCTDFDYFVTLTLDPQKIDRYSIDDAVARMRSWLDNRVRRHGLRYILVPELHKDGAVHFHGFFNAEGCTFTDSGTLKIPGQKAPRMIVKAATREKYLADGAQVVYNIADWTLGFSTAIPLYGERSAAVAYVCKYVTKSPQKIGGRWYYSGGELRRAEVSFWDFSYRDLEQRGAYTFAVSGMAAAFAILRGGSVNELFADDSGVSEDGGSFDAADRAASDGWC